MSIYPFTLYPYEYSTGNVDSPRLARAIWTRLRKEDPSLTDKPWYAVGVEVSAEVLELHIYRMWDNFCGGPGHLDFTVPVKRSDLTVDEQALLLEEEQREALELAEQELVRLANEAHEKRRQALAESLFPHLFDAQTKEQQP